jgi:biotin carboxyl carrier protein
MKYEVTVADHLYTIEINQEGVLTLDGQEIHVDFTSIIGSNLYSLIVENESFEAFVEPREDHWEVLMRGFLYEVTITDERSRRLSARARMAEPEGGELHIKAPMPGLVVTIPVNIGDQILKGQNVIILESMKMENELKAPRDGVVERINVAKGDSVEKNQVLVVIV